MNMCDFIRGVADGMSRIGESSESSVYFEYSYSDDCISEENILEEFLSDRQSGVKTRRWDLIPFEQYRNILVRSSKTSPELFRAPSGLMDEWLFKICRDTDAIQHISSFAGHTQWFPAEAITNVFGPDDGLPEVKIGDTDYEVYSDFLDNIGFYDWCKLPDGSDAWSDYGIKPLYDILQKIDVNSDDYSKLVAVNRCIDVVHCRGDITSAFIEGGSNACSSISEYRQD